MLSSATLNPSGVLPDPDMEELAARPYTLSRPSRQTAPYIFASPHSGRVYPPSFQITSRLNALQLRRSEDAYVEELFASVPGFGAPILCAEFPRVYIDVNRAPGELDPAMFGPAFSLPVGPRTPRVAAGFGVIPRVVREGQEIYGGVLGEEEATFRLERFYKPYHAVLAELVRETQERFGCAIVIDCHSMPPSARARDVVIGDCFGVSARSELIAFVQQGLSDVGFHVTRNTPYAGGYTTNLYGQPKEKVEALQIEINRALYLDEASMEKTPGFNHTREKLDRFLGRLFGAELLWQR